MKGKGTIIARYNGTTWDDIAEVYSINGGGRQTEDIEDEDLLDLTTETYRQRAPGSQHLNPIVVEIRWDPREAAQGANQDLFKTDYESKAISYWRIRYTDDEDSGEVWKAYVKEIGDAEITPSGMVKKSITLMPDGSLYVHQEDITTYTPA